MKYAIDFFVRSLNAREIVLVDAESAAEAREKAEAALWHLGLVTAEVQGDPRLATNDDIGRGIEWPYAGRSRAT